MAGKYALLIGNSKFEDPGLSRLKAPDADVRAFEEVLRAPDICEFDEVVTLIDQGLADVLRQIARFYGKRRRDDLLLLYFSGHGVKDDAGHLYLAVRDTDRALLAGTAVPSHFVSSQMDACHSRALVLMLDCCNSGAFAAGAKAVLSMDTRSAFEGNGAGRIVLTATDSTQYAWEGDRVIGDEAENSLFTHFIVEGLRTGAADRDEDGYISVDELYDYVYEQIQQRTHKQTPKKCVYNAHGEFKIAKNCSPKAAALPDDLVEKLESPIRAVVLEAIPEAEIHLKNIRRMTAAEEQLERLARDHDSNKVRQAAAAARKRHSARKLLEAGRPGEALTEITQALELDREHRGGVALRDKIMQRIVDLRREAIAAYAAEIDAHLNNRDLDAAERAFVRADEELKDLPELASLRQQVQNQRDRIDRERNELTAHAAAGAAAIAAGRFTDAQASIDRLVSIRSDAPEVATLRQALEQARADEEVKKLVERADRVRHMDAEAALVIIQSALELDPQHAVARGIHAAIVAAIIAAVTKEARTLLSEGHVDRGAAIVARVDAELGHPNELQALCDDVNLAISKRDDQVKTHLETARAAIQAGDFARAIATLEKASRLNPQASGLADLQREAEERLAAFRRRIDARVAEAEALRSTDPEAALRLIESVLLEDSRHTRAREIKTAVTAAIQRARALDEKLANLIKAFDSHLSNHELEAAAQLLAGAEAELQPRLQLQQRQLHEKLAERDAVTKAAQERARRIAAAAEEIQVLQSHPQHTAARSLQQEIRDGLEHQRRDRIAEIVRQVDDQLRNGQFADARVVLERAFFELGSDGVLSGAQERVTRAEKDHRRREQRARVSDALLKYPRLWRARQARPRTERPAYIGGLYWLKIGAALAVMALVGAVVRQIPSDELQPANTTPIAPVSDVPRPDTTPAGSLPPPPEVLVPPREIGTPFAPTLPPVEPTRAVQPEVRRPSESPPTVKPVPSPEPLRPAEGRRGASPPAETGRGGDSPGRGASQTAVPPSVIAGTPVVSPAPAPARPSEPNPVTTPPAPLVNVPNEPPRTAAAPSASPPPAVVPASPPPAPAAPPRDDRRDIEEVLQQYQAAYSQLDAAAIRELWPTIPTNTLNQIARSFSQSRSGEMQLHGANVTIQGTTATAVSEATVSFVPNVGRANSQRIVATFRLQKVANRWVIESFEAKAAR